MLAPLFGLAAMVHAAIGPLDYGYYLDLGTYPSIKKANHAIDSGQRIIGVKTGSIIKTDSPDRNWAYIAGFDTEDQAKAACAKLIAKGRRCEAKPIYPP
ncbi:hypothetical protein PMI01_02597 [Caulobacter sp. AP07]|uniref:SPOR domain-containing protein n=1 Tax=Caulobacter sp. AP07 TaxID=1144304 RepID=UPI0002720193|nr:SPOR domain-containing protein [Caulobacter sp. AP07]EJL32217.1 hypothetical protein PMI01_02597 [Caulobacter sp. AP07]